MESGEISLTKWRHGLVDMIFSFQSVLGVSQRTCALFAIFTILGDLVSMASKLEAEHGDVEKLTVLCHAYRISNRLYSGSKGATNSTFLMGIAIPFFAERAYVKHGAGLGIFSMEGREAVNKTVSRTGDYCN